MLRKIRIAFAIFFFVLITLLFLDFTGTLHAWFGWMAKVQFLPALLALNVGVVVFLIALTLIFGRILFGYMSAWCIPRCSIVDGRKKKKESVSLLPDIGLVTIWSAGSICYCTCCKNRLVCSITGTL